MAELSVYFRNNLHALSCYLFLSTTTILLSVCCLRRFYTVLKAIPYPKFINRKGRKEGRPSGFLQEKYDFRKKCRFCSIFCRFCTLPVVFNRVFLHLNYKVEEFNIMFYNSCCCKRILMKTKQTNIPDKSRCAVIHSEDGRSFSFAAEPSVCDRKDSFASNRSYACQIVNEYEQIPSNSYRILTGGGVKPFLTYSLYLYNNSSFSVNPNRLEASVFPRRSEIVLHYNKASEKGASPFPGALGFVRLKCLNIKKRPDERTANMYLFINN
jgi:hypothetical protein